MLVLASFLPWMTFDGYYVDGVQGRRTFSGPELATECTSRRFPSQCVVEDQAISSEFVPDTIVTGAWALVLGIVLVVIGVLATRAQRGRIRGGPVVVAGWLAALSAISFAIWTLAEFTGGSNGVGSGPEFGSGVIVAAVSPALAIVGLAVLQVVLTGESQTPHRFNVERP